MGLRQKERSGTPRETRGAARAAGGVSEQFFQSLLEGGGEDPFGRLRAASMRHLLGFDPGMVGFGDAARSALQDPADATRGLFTALDPFERRQSQQLSADVREGFSNFGGRFGREAADLETRARGELANQFALTRQQGLLQANQQRNQALASLLALTQGAHQTAQDPISQLLAFSRPGSPVFEPSGGQQALSTAASLAPLLFI